MKKLILLSALSVLVSGIALANEKDREAAEAARAEASQKAQLASAEARSAAEASAEVAEEAELVRAEAEKARREAQRISERARETARLQAELMREESERSAVQSEEARAARAAREEEMERAREELSRAHRELREAQREIARAHSDLARSETYRVMTRVASSGDRPVIGVVLGEASPEGVALIGVSPDGPAETAGIEAGDVMVAIQGVELAGRENDAKSAVFEVMEVTKAGDSVEITVDRDGQPLSFAVVAEVREPASWQSLVRLPEIARIESVDGVPGERRFVVESVVVPEIDEEALAERMEILRERLAENKFDFHEGEFPHEIHQDFEFETGDFSDLAGHAFSTANVFFGLPQAQGLELATINEGLGAYFKADRGVLVLKAREDNAYRLEAGDVILSVGSDEVASPSELVRALREIEPGDTIELGIKRDGRDKTLEVVMPENRLGLR